MLWCPTHFHFRHFRRPLPWVERSKEEPASLHLASSTVSWTCPRTPSWNSGENAPNSCVRTGIHPMAWRVQNAHNAQRSVRESVIEVRARAHTLPQARRSGCTCWGEKERPTRFGGGEGAHALRQGTGCQFWGWVKCCKSFVYSFRLGLTIHFGNYTLSPWFLLPG
jgi:hypothetical protein